METETLKIFDSQIAEAKKELELFNISLSELTEQSLELGIRADIQGKLIVGEMGLPEFSSSQSPAIHVEREASFCTLLFATDKAGNVMTWHRPEIYGAGENLINPIKDKFEEAEEKIMLVTGTHEKIDQKRTIDFVESNFPNFKIVYLMLEDERYPFSNIVFVPAELSANGRAELYIGNVDKVESKISNKFPNLER